MSKKLWMKFPAFLFPKWQQSWTPTKLHTFLPITSSFILNFLILFSNKVLSFQLSFDPNFQHKHILALIVQKNPNLPEIPYTIESSWSHYTFFYYIPENLSKSIRIYLLDILLTLPNHGLLLLPMLMIFPTLY